MILASPRTGSFNHAIADTAVAVLKAQGYIVIFHDLYAERFDPVLPSDEIPRDAVLDPVVARHCREIREADGIIIVHPDWWGQPPAILKGWVDRVLRPGIAYRFAEDDNGEGIPAGLLKAKTALVFNTANTPRDRELAVFSDPLEALWGRCIFSFCGIPEFHRRMFAVVVTSTKSERAAWITEVEQGVKRHFPAVC